MFSICRYDCDKVWAAFQQAYVGRDPCKVPMQAYDPFITLTHFDPACNKVKLTVSYELLWKWITIPWPFHIFNHLFGFESRWCSGAKPKTLCTATQRRTRLVLSLWKTLCWGRWWTTWPGVEKRAVVVRRPLAWRGILARPKDIHIRCTLRVDG